MRRRGLVGLPVVFLAGLVLALAGCGGGGSKKSASSTTTASTSATQSTQTTSTAAATTTQATTTQATTPSGFVASGKCKQLQTKAQGLATALTNAKGNLQQEAQAFQSFVSEVPSEIKGDAKTVADAFSKYVAALKSAGIKQGQVPNASQVARAAVVLRSIDTPKLRQAEQSLTAWVKKNCGG